MFQAPANPTSIENHSMTTIAPDTLTEIDKLSDFVVNDPKDEKIKRWNVEVNT